MNIFGQPEENMRVVAIVARLNDWVGYGINNVRVVITLDNQDKFSFWLKEIAKITAESTLITIKTYNYRHLMFDANHFVAMSLESI